MDRSVSRIVLIAISLYIGGCASVPVDGGFLCKKILNETDDRMRGPEDIVFNRRTGVAYVSMMDGNSGVYNTQYSPASAEVFSPLRKAGSTEHNRSHGMDIHGEKLYVIEHSSKKTDELYLYNVDEAEPQLESIFLINEASYGMNDIAVSSTTDGDICVVSSVNNGRVLGNRGRFMYAKISEEYADRRPAKLKLLETGIVGRFGNGVLYDARTDISYVAFSRDREVRVYMGSLCEMKSSLNPPDPIHIIPIDGMPDNISQNPKTGQLYVAAQGSQLGFLFGKYFDTWSQFYRIDPDNDYKVTELKMRGLDGRGSSVITSVDSDTFLIGSVYGENIHYCERE